MKQLEINETFLLTV